MTAPTSSVARDHYAATQSFVDATAQVAGQMWSQVDPDNIVDSWVQQLPELTTVVSGAQLGVANQADAYVGEALESQGLSDEAVAPIQPTAFAGTASDGRGLMTLLANPVVVTLLTISDIVDVGRAMGAGRANLDMLVRTQVADAGRAADQVSLVAHPAADGYIRQTDGNPCSRCLLLAGKRYQWNQGFLRHPRCGCTHVPAGAGVVPQDPMRLYRAMSQAERIRAGFTRAEMRALEEGADIGQVVNARRGLFTAGGRRFTTEGTTRRGLFATIARQQDGLTRGQRLTRPRLTPEQIYREAGADRAEAVRLLQRNGYLLPSPSAPGRAAGARGTVSTVDVRPTLTAAESLEDVSWVLGVEYQRVTGRTMTVDLRGSVETAREHAEGVLRAVERNPEIAITAVRTGRTTRRGSYAEAHGQEIVFSSSWSSVARRQDYLAAAADDVRRGWSPMGTGSPVSVAAHEAGHVLDPRGLNSQIDELLDRAAAQTGVSRDQLVRAGVSEYAESNYAELVAEAFADVVMNGAQASGLSRAIVRMVETSPRRGRGGVIIAGEVLPSATDLSRLPITRLQVMVREAGITVPTGLRKPALVRLVDDLDSGVPAATARARAVASIVEERRGIADALTRAVEVEDLSGRAMRSVATALRRELSAEQVKTLRPLLAALDAGDGAAVRAAIPAVARTAKLRQIGEAGAAQRIPAAQVEWIGDGRSAVVSVVRPGWETTVERRVVLLQRAAAQAATPEQAARLAPVKAAKKAAKAAPAKKATPRKAPAPPAPERMTAPALRKELTDRGVTLDVTGVPKPILAEHVARLRSGSPAAAETARLRQAVIDRQRAAAETLAEAVEILDIGAEALGVRARARLRRIEATITGWPQEAPIRSLLTAMQTGNPATIRRAVATAERRLGLTRVDVSTMDRSLMTPVGGTIRDGARVEVVRPGYTVEVGGERVVLSKAVVRDAGPGPDFDARAIASASGQPAVRLVPAHMKGAADAGRIRGRVPPASTQEGFAQLQSYRAFGYTTVNRRNRGQRGDWESHAPEFATELDARIASIDALMDRSPITSDILVYRGAGTGRGIFGDRLQHDLTGFSWREDSYMSTSLSQRLAGEFAGDPSSEATVGVLMRLVLPTGTRAVYLGEFEGELLAQRGLRLRVVRDRGEVWVEAGRVRRVARKRVRMLDVEVIPE